MPQHDDIEERLRHLEQNVARDAILIGNLKEEQDRMRQGWSRVIWIVGGGILSALVAFITKGGLAN